jgi:hypothetical protein
VTSQVTPYSAFKTAYESDSGQSATTWAFASTQYYVTIGFPQWDGYSVFQDPVFVGYVSSRGSSEAPTSVQFSGLGINTEIPEDGEPVQVSANIYSEYTILYAEIWYSVDGGPWQQIEMQSVGSWYYGDIPGFEDGQRVEYYIRVYTTDGPYDSAHQVYIVGQGIVTTSTPPPRGNDNFALLVLLGGGIAVVAIVAVVAMKRRR